MSIPNRLAYLGWQYYGISTKDIVWGTLHCTPEQIQPFVVLAPWWSPSIFKSCRIESIADGIAKVDRLTCGNLSFTMIRTGIGAPLSGDATIALGCTPCTHIIFIGSVGGLDANQRIGDLAIPSRSLSGDGFSMYLPQSADGPHWQPSQSAMPDQELQSLIVQTSRDIAESNGLAVHIGPVYSIDTILAQFQHLDWIVDQQHCIGIEMETSAVFRAAQDTTEGSQPRRRAFFPELSRCGPWTRIPVAPLHRFFRTAPSGFPVYSGPLPIAPAQAAACWDFSERRRFGGGGILSHAGGGTSDPRDT